MKINKKEERKNKHENGVQIAFIHNVLYTHVDTDRFLVSESALSLYKVHSSVAMHVRMQVPAETKTKKKELL